MTDINNFKLINKYLSFLNDGDFYFLQVLKRRKDNPGMTGDSQVIKNYYIYGYDTFLGIENEVIKLCLDNNARAYIRLNKRNNKKIALQCLKKTTDLIINEDYKAVKNVYESVCGEYHNDIDKKWIVDIDGIHLKYKDEIYKIINELHQQIIDPNKPYRILGEIPTKNGFHIITNPFNLQLFKSKYFLGKVIDMGKQDELAIHKDNPTILFCKSN